MVVQPNQTTGIVDKLKQKGNQVEMITFPEEGHGFRQAESIITSLDSEYGFYMDVFTSSKNRSPELNSGSVNS